MAEEVGPSKAGLPLFGVIYNLRVLWSTSQSDCVRHTVELDAGRPIQSGKVYQLLA
jgi:hypothetical protein